MGRAAAVVLLHCCGRAAVGGGQGLWCAAAGNRPGCSLSRDTLLAAAQLLLPCRSNSSCSRVAEGRSACTAALAAVLRIPISLSRLLLPSAGDAGVAASIVATATEGATGMTTDTTTARHRPGALCCLLVRLGGHPCGCSCGWLLCRLATDSVMNAVHAAVWHALSPMSFYAAAAPGCSPYRS